MYILTYTIQVKEICLFTHFMCALDFVLTYIHGTCIHKLSCLLTGSSAGALGGVV